MQWGWGTGGEVESITLKTTLGCSSRKQTLESSRTEEKSSCLQRRAGLEMPFIKGLNYDL